MHSIRIFLCAFLTLNTSIFAMELAKCKIPSQETLKERLKAHRIFVENTSIIERVANKELTAL